MPESKGDNKGPWENDHQGNISKKGSFVSELVEVSEIKTIKKDDGDSSLSIGFRRMNGQPDSPNETVYFVINPGNIFQRGREYLFPGEKVLVETVGDIRDLRENKEEGGDELRVYRNGGKRDLLYQGIPR